MRAEEGEEQMLVSVGSALLKKMNQTSRSLLFVIMMVVTQFWIFGLFLLFYVYLFFPFRDRVSWSPG